MRILELHAENIKGIKVVDITPDPHMQKISGRNGQGKTSVLDAIWLAVQNKTANKTNPTVIRDGEEEANVELDLGKYVVRRFWKRKDGDSITTRILVETGEGHSVKSPQALLDGFINGLSFDLMQFIQGSGTPEGQRRQRQMLIDAFGLSAKLSDHDRVIDEESESRRELKRKYKSIDTELKSVAVPTDADPTDEMSVKDVMQRLDKAREHGKLRAEEKELEQRIASLQLELVDTRAELAELGDVEPEDRILTEMEDLELRNNRAREVKRYHALRSQANRLSADIQLANDKIELSKLNKDETLENVKLPISGLEVMEDGIYFDGVPFVQKSDAEKMKVALAVAMAANPDLRVIRITNGSLLDEDSMLLLKEIAEENDYQIWIEIVDGTGDVGVYIEEGEVKSVNP